MASKEIEEIYDKINPGICKACGGKLYFERVSLDYNSGEKLYVIEDVPAFVCGECGEIWIPKPVVEELEKMVKAYYDKDEEAFIDEDVEKPKDKLNG